MIIEGDIYAITALVSALICFAILVCNNIIYERESVIRSYFSFLLINYIISAFIESAWGFMDTGTLRLGRTVFCITTFAAHFYTIFAISCWCIFLTNYFGFRESRFVMILQTIPLAFAVIILCTQFFADTVFTITPDGDYIPGPFRNYLYFIRITYYLIVFVKILYFLIRHHDRYGIRYKLVIFVCATVPAFFNALQFIYPDGAYTQLGFIISAVISFNCMMIIEKDRKSKRYEMISKDRYTTLEAISQGLVTVVLLDLEKKTDMVIKSTPYAESLMKPDMALREKVLAPFLESSTPEYVDQLRDFADIEKLPEKLENRRSISMQYCSTGIGWCVLSFTAAERDEERNLKKVVLSVQSIDEYKKKEKEFESALSRAYENQNAVFAELIRMQTVGVLATYTNREIMVANDAVLEMFGREGQNVIGMTAHDFFEGMSVKFPEDLDEQYMKLIDDGGEFTYQLVVYPNVKGREERYFIAEVKRIDLLDGQKVSVTCYTDITTGKLLEDKLRTLSETDGLCGIANRRCGESQVRLLLSEGVGGIYCLFDVNEFKKINDTHGHMTGDEVLIAVARAIKASFRSDDIFMRLGGDEFAIYMRGVTKPELAKLRIARLFENIARIELPEIPKGSVTISLGAVIVEPVDGVIDVELDTIYQKADSLMYECKGKPGSNSNIS